MKRKIYIGTSGWFYEHWREKFYPSKLNKSKWLSYYSKYFNTTEINMTFYRTPFPNMIKGWYNKVPENFRFTLKASRFITHIKKFRNVKRELKRFYNLVNMLKEKLACILFQAPPSFHYNEKNMKVLKDFLNLLDKSKRNVIEFRHKSWWNRDIEKILKNKISFCVVSGLNMPSDVIITTNFAYFRFHGLHYTTCYSEKELEEWARKIKKAKEKVKEIYCYFNNDTNAYAVKNALKLKSLIEK